MFQDKYDFSDIKEFLSESINLIFVGNKTDERSLYVQTNLSEFKGMQVLIEGGRNLDTVTIKELNKLNGHSEEYEYSSIWLGIKDYLQSKKVHERNILIDITGIQHPVLFILVKILLTEISPRLFFAAYTEPENYIKENSSLSGFSLSDDFLDLKSIPGFIRRDRGKDKILVSTLGFEGHRLLTLLEDIQPSPKKIIPIIGFPTYAPGWKSTAIVSNCRVLKSYNCFGEIRLCEAASPYNLYMLLKKIAKIYDGDELLLAPLGTRPHALGIALYAVLNSNCAVIYDFPIEKDKRSIGIHKTNVYHLSRFIS